VKVIVVTAPKPVAMNEDNCCKPFPLKVVIVVDEDPFDTTTETKPSSTAKLTSRDVHEEEGRAKLVWYW